jgi:hypothetical protein
MMHRNRRRALSTAAVPRWEGRFICSHCDRFTVA